MKKISVPPGIWRFPAIIYNMLSGDYPSFDIRIFDISDPANPSLSGNFAAGDVGRIFIEGVYLYLTDSATVQL